MRWFISSFALIVSIPVLADEPSVKVAADLKILEEIKDRNQIVRNLSYLSDVIGPRLTGSAALERANNWAAEKMKEYGLENVRQEPYEIPIGWTRGTASLTMLEPSAKPLTAVSAGWTRGTDGPVKGPVVLFDARTRKDLESYKGKLQGAIVLRGKPVTIAPVTDTSYGPGSSNRRPRDKAPAGKAPSEAERREYFAVQNELNEFFKAEGVAAVLRDSGKPHGLLITTGGFKADADRVTAISGTPTMYVIHEHYALLARLISEQKTPPVVEVNIRNTFSDGPVTVYNTVGELTGSEKPDEYVILGAHLDSWDLGSGTTDNGTGTSVILETARALGAMAKAGIKPKRTIRFVLFSGEEQGLHGSKNYVRMHKNEHDRISAALVHDTGTGKVLNLRMMGRSVMLPILGPELATLKNVGFEGVVIDSSGSTDHVPFETAGIPGFPCKQETDEYRFTHHTQSDTFDKAKPENLVQGAQVLAVAAYRIADLDKLLPREKPKKEETPRPKKPE